ncbi:MAG TPA: YebC/PmpR family DNA-binding transcriptional regulator [Candidatus Gracilibacteria bacterium]|nr:YebC/PmpR family DNA-binding transcriptional regulator [Candidatus Gracilibacteria bacterium]
MAGHSKWHNIKHRKAGVDKKRGKIFTKHAKLIQVEASLGGGDPDMNPGLRAAIDNARSDNVPMDNIKRAIEKGTGEGKDAARIEEVLFEGFGPGNSALYIQTLTDNRNRTIASMNVIMGKKGGKLGAAGSVGYLFERKGLIEVESAEKPSDEVQLQMIDAGAMDVKFEDGIIEIYTDPQELMQVRNKLKETGIETKSANLVYIPQTTVAVDDEAQALQLLNLIEALEEDDDIDTVYTNADIPDEVMEKFSDS